MKRALTYDDVNIVPKYSEVISRGDIGLTTRFTKNTELKIPIVSSPMDTVTEYDMAYEMKERGGVGVVHRFMSIEEQAEIMEKLCYLPGSEHVLVKDNLPKCASVGVTGDYFGADLSGILTAINQEDHQ